MFYKKTLGELNPQNGATGKPSRVNISYLKNKNFNGYV
jgi:hypothetical protein